MRIVKRSIVMAMSAATVLLVGCRGDEEKSSLPVVQIKVWVVLGGGETRAHPISGGMMVCQSDNTTPCTTGTVFDDCPEKFDDKCITEVRHRDNAGCRLTDDEMLDFISHLRGNNPTFGGVRFSLSNIVIEDAFDETMTRPHDIQDFETWALADNHKLDKLNIYFVGEMRDITDPQPFDGATVDPRETFGANNGKPYVLIEDGGGTNDPNVPDTPPFESGRNPHFETRGNLLEHEVAHFLLDRDSCPPYLTNNTEHVPQAYNHILVTDGPYKAKLPPSEQREIQCRVSGTLPTYLDPSDCCSACICPSTSAGCCTN